MDQIEETVSRGHLTLFFSFGRKKSREECNSVSTSTTQWYSRASPRYELDRDKGWVKKRQHHAANWSMHKRRVLNAKWLCFIIACYIIWKKKSQIRNTLHALLPAVTNSTRLILFILYNKSNPLKLYPSILSWYLTVK